MNNKMAKDLLVPVSDYPHVRHDASVKDAFYILYKNFKDGKGYRRILVLDEKNQLKGLLSLSDLIRAVEPIFLKTHPSAYQGLSPDYPALTLIWQELFSSQCRDEAKKQIKETISPIRAMVEPDDPIAKVAYLMVTTNSPVIPVIEDEKVIGVVRLVDVFNEITRVVLEIE